MAKEKVEVQMRRKGEYKGAARYEAPCYSEDVVCWKIYVRKKAFEKLGKPDVIRVTIEAVQSDDVQ